MATRTVRLGAVWKSGLLLLLTACLGTFHSEGDQAAERSQEDREDMPDNAVLVERDALEDSDDWLLYVLASHVPSISSRYNPENPAERCPRVSLRGPIVGTSISNPVVYVDGTRTSNTCVLVNIRSAEVDWVEIYPTGATRRPGYVTHPHGLILVFMRRY